MQTTYLLNARKTFRQYKELGEEAFNQVSPNRINWYFHNDSNSIAILVKHISGNMQSRFSDFLTSDGEKENRRRDGEFIDDVLNKDEMMTYWNNGWECLFNTLDSLTPEDIEKTVLIRGEEHTVLEAINRQLTHYAYHIGQIVFLSKMLSSDWESLSIPKGGSTAFNKKMMDVER